MIYKKSESELEIMRRGGRILSDVLGRLHEAIRPGVTTKALDRLAEAAITAAGAKPSFRGYRGFPASICTSLNEVIVHGIPGTTVLGDGDIISIDVGVHYQGLHVDSAWTFPVGDIPSETAALLKTTEAALYAGIEQCRPRNRIGDVGHAIQQLAEGAGYSIVREYVGHGVGRQLHEQPHVPNYGPPGRRELLAPGMVLAIEPMVNAGGPETKALDDGWTVVSGDGSLSAHFEHSVAVTRDDHEILTGEA